MSRFLVLPAIVLSLALAGCISPDALQQHDAKTPAAVAPPAQRIDGMTADATAVDKVVSCNQGAGPVPIPAASCMERTLVVTGRIGVEKLPIDLSASNGPIMLAGTSADGDAWSFTAVYRVKAATPDEAKKGLDTAWSWRHEKNGAHVLEAGPNSTVPVLGPSVEYAKYEVALPAWVLASVKATTSNGIITLQGLRTDAADLHTSNGIITIEGAIKDLAADTSNGGIAAVVTPEGSGKISLRTSNGGIELTVPESRAHGYDLDAKTSNGGIRIGLHDGTPGGQKDHGTFKTNGFDARAIQTGVTLATSNGGIVVDAS